MSVAGEMFVLLSDAVDIINELRDRWEPNEFTEEDKDLIQRVNNLKESYRNIG
jgi:hypothetical protein